jgi:hypothetical protein
VPLSEMMWSSEKNLTEGEANIFRRKVGIQLPIVAPLYPAITERLTKLLMQA